MEKETLHKAMVINKMIDELDLFLGYLRNNRMIEISSNKNYDNLILRYMYESSELAIGPYLLKDKVHKTVTNFINSLIKITEVEILDLKSQLNQL